MARSWVIPYRETVSLNGFASGSGSDVVLMLSEGLFFKVIKVLNFSPQLIVL